MKMGHEIVFWLQIVGIAFGVWAIFAAPLIVCALLF